MHLIHLTTILYLRESKYINKTFTNLEIILQENSKIIT